jgi:hypothetical protein
MKTQQPGRRMAQTPRPTTLAALGGVAVVAMVAVACVALLSGCTEGLAHPEPNGAQPPATTAATAPAMTDQERFAAQDAVAGKTYTVRQQAGTYSGTFDGDVSGQATGPTSGTAGAEFTVPASTVAGANKLVLLLNCTGSGRYSITVEQAHPNTVGATCGDGPGSVAAVPVDDPTSPVTLKLSVPLQSDYWLSAFYAQG